MFDLENQIKNAPTEVKQKMAAASAAHKRYQHARKQVSLWQEEQEIAGAVHTAAQADWVECLNRWNPETNVLEEKQLAPKQVINA